ncbi:MAG: sugar transferase [Lachnospiraceae bacterium]|nr:sugar transferase [Lachnospiraceae bacterium]
MYKKHLKRALAVFMSSVGIICLSWLFLLIIVAIKIDSPGPVLFKQKRVGIHKKYFNIFKFRTMRVDTPKDMPTHLLENPEQYITKVGKFLRKTSLDEIPQLFNIFKGDMAVVGPRPALWNQFDLIEERDKYGANDVRPGLTGWAQINGRDELEIDEKARLDGYYVQNMSFWMDIKCFFGTIKPVIKNEGYAEGKQGSVPQNEAEKHKKILVITNHSYMFWQFRKELIAELMKEHEVVLSMPFVGHEDDFQAMGLRCIETKVDRRGMNLKKDLELLKTYYTMLRNERPDMVITYSIKPNVYAGLACGKLRIPFCANVQGLGTAFEKPILAQFVTGLYKMSFRKVKTVFFENEADAVTFQKHRIIPQEKQVVLRGAGINLEHYAFQPYPDNEIVHFLYLGRIMKEKGMDELFSAVLRLKSEGEKFILDLVGFFEEEYREQVLILQDKGIVVFHGFQEDSRPYYAAADCIVMPSYHEGMSNVLLEAAAIGRPIITCDIPGCREAVENGTTGTLVQVKDEVSLYNAMKQMLEMKKEQRQEMGVSGRRKMEREFPKEMVVEETMKKIFM